MNKKVFTFVFLLFSSLSLRADSNFPIVIDDEYYLPTNLVDFVILNQLLNWPYAQFGDTLDDYTSIYDYYNDIANYYWSARHNSVRSFTLFSEDFLGQNSMYRISTLHPDTYNFPGWHDSVAQELILRSQLGIYTNTLNSSFNYNSSYLLTKSPYDFVFGSSLTGDYAVYNYTDYSSPADFLSAYYAGQSHADAEKTSLLHSLFLAGNSGSTNGLGIPTTFTNSLFASTIESSVRKPIEQAIDGWKQHFDVSMQAMTTNRIASQALITNKLAQTNNKLDALNQAIGNPNDAGNNNTLLGRVVHIDEDLHRILERLDNQGGAGGGGSGESGNDYADLSQAINCYWNIDWSNTVFNLNSDMLSYRSTMFTTQKEYADNWEENYSDTSGQGNSVKMRQVLGLIYTQTVLLDEIRRQQNSAYYADLTNTLSTLDEFLWNNNIPAQGANPMERGVKALARKGEAAISTAQSISDSFRTNTVVVEGIQQNFDSIKESVNSAFETIIKPFQENTSKLRLLGASNPGGRPHIRNAEISFNSATQSTYTIRLNFANSNDFSDFSETTRNFVRYATNTFLAIYTLLLIHKWSLSIAKRFGG